MSVMVRETKVIGTEKPFATRIKRTLSEPDDVPRVSTTILPSLKQSALGLWSLHDENVALPQYVAARCMTVALHRSHSHDKGSAPSWESASPV
jgi:hypothetical protein